MTTAIIPKNKTFNYGFAILRVLMCFEVILVHCWSQPSDKNLIIDLLIRMEFIAVPVFMFMSFFLTQDKFINLNAITIKSRLMGLWKPLWVWAIIYFAIYSLFSKQLKTNPTWSDFFWQAFLGHSPDLNMTMWFQFDILLISVVFFFIYFIFDNKRYSDICIAIVGILALYSQYFGWNLIFTGLRPELSAPLGRFAEMLPVAAAGLLIARTNFFTATKDKWLIWLIIDVLLVLFLLYGKVFSPIRGFAYAGIYYVVMAFLFVHIFYILPLEQLNKTILKFVLFFSSYTLGIYCMHRLIAAIFNVLRGHDYRTGNSLLNCVIIYIICFIVAFILHKLFKDKLKQVI